MSSGSTCFMNPSAVRTKIFMKVIVADFQLNLRQFDFLMSVVDALILEFSIATNTGRCPNMVFVRRLKEFLLVTLVPLLAAWFAFFLLLFFRGVYLVVIL